MGAVDRGMSGGARALIDACPGTRTRTDPNERSRGRRRSTSNTPTHQPTYPVLRPQFHELLGQVPRRHVAWLGWCCARRWPRSPCVCRAVVCRDGDDLNARGASGLSMESTECEGLPPERRWRSTSNTSNARPRSRCVGSIGRQGADEASRAPGTTVDKCEREPMNHHQAAGRRLFGSSSRRRLRPRPQVLAAQASRMALCMRSRTQRAERLANRSIGARLGNPGVRSRGVVGEAVWAIRWACWASADGPKHAGRTQTCGPSLTPYCFCVIPVGRFDSFFLSPTVRSTGPQASRRSHSPRVVVVRACEPSRPCPRIFCWEAMHGYLHFAYSPFPFSFRSILALP